MTLHVTFPSLLTFEDLALFVVRLVVAIVFGASGYFDLKDPAGRAKSVELGRPATVTLGVAEVLGSLGVLTGVLIQPAAKVLTPADPGGGLRRDPPRARRRVICVRRQPCATALG